MKMTGCCWCNEETLKYGGKTQQLEGNKSIFDRIAKALHEAGY